MAGCLSRLGIKSKINLHTIDDFPNDVLTGMNGIYVSLVPSTQCEKLLAALLLPMP
jgi:hypothetical protein